MENFGRYNLCCNPQQLENHRVKNSLRRASVTQQTLYNLSADDYLCTVCRKSLVSENTASDSIDVANDNVENKLEDVRTESTLSSIPSNLSGKTSRTKCPEFDCNKISLLY